MVTSTRDRVPLNTDACINASIRRKTENNIAYFTSGGTDAITRRLAELDQEWDIERMLETNAATATLIGMTLGITVSKKWFVLPAAVLEKMRFIHTVVDEVTSDPGKLEVAVSGQQQQQA